MNLYGGHSWEEHAFSKDAAGTLYTWPPRSYSCSFCGREFRSAQALGGHMNVHRRDRARLKQSPIHPTQNSFSSSQMCSFIHKNRNSEFSYAEKLDSQVIRVSSAEENKPRLCIVPPLFCERNRVSDSIQNEMKTPSSKSRAGREDYDGQDLSVNLSRTQRNAGSCKRRRFETPLNFLPTLSLVERFLPMKEASSRLYHGSAEEAVLDLELRLGDAPKVK